MTMPRSQLVDVSVTRYYHCISRCVRRAVLCGEGCEHRKQWIEDRLEVLAANFAVSVCGFAVMDNHLHVLVRLDPEEAKDWSDEDVVRRWIAVYPPKTPKGEEIEINQAWIDQQLHDTKRVAAMREGMLEGLSLGSYLLLVDYTSRLCRQGKARVSREVASILDRLGTSAETWSHRISRLISKDRHFGSYFATDVSKLRDLAARRGRHHLDNLLGAT